MRADFNLRISSSHSVLYWAIDNLSTVGLDLNCINESGPCLLLDYNLASTHVFLGLASYRKIS